MLLHPVVYHGWVALTSIIAIIATAHYMSNSLSGFSANYEFVRTHELQWHNLNFSRIFEKPEIADHTYEVAENTPDLADHTRAVAIVTEDVAENTASAFLPTSPPRRKVTAVKIIGSKTALQIAADDKRVILNTSATHFQSNTTRPTSVHWPRLRLLKIIVYRYTITIQLARLIFELGRWAIVQTTSILVCWDIAIFSFCILFNLKRRWCLLWAGLSRRPSAQVNLPSVTLPDDAKQAREQKLEHDYIRVAIENLALRNSWAAAQERARRQRLAFRYIYKWRLIIADRVKERLYTTIITAGPKSLDDRQISESTPDPFEEQRAEQTPLPSSCLSALPAPSDPVGTTPSGELPPTLPVASSDAKPESVPLSRPLVRDGSSIEDKPNWDADGSIPGKGVQPGEPAKDLNVAGNKVQTPGSSEGSLIPKQPTSTFTQPKPPPSREKPTKKKMSGDKAFRPRPGAPAFLMPKPGPKQGPKRDPPPSPPSRLGGMVIATDAPVMTRLCERDKACPFRVCGKAHHGPLVDPSAPFKIQGWCRYNQGCTARNCDRWHGPPASASLESGQ